jgi:tRNA threonylcarbamoyladenosine biosynthesis protein TsaB
MRVLAFDTSSSSGSVALMDDGALVAESNAADVGTHASWLMEAIDRLLVGAHTDIRSVDAFAVSAGPGSFTGLRIGISTVKGLAWALDKRVFAVPTLKALAYNLRSRGGHVCALLDARKKEVYAALYTFERGSVMTVIEGSAMSPHQLVEAIARAGIQGPVSFLGNALREYSEVMKGGVKDAVISPEALWDVRASNIAAIAFEGSLEALSPIELTPVYLRKSEAENAAPGRRPRGI